MYKIRQSVFETNSSSTHSLILCSDEDYKKLRDGELFVENKYSTSLVSKEERDKQIKEILSKHAELNEDDLDSYGWDLPISLDEWCDDEYLEYGYDDFQTKNGEIVHAIYKYGYDG